jgi:hypothetical protein
LLRRKIRCVGIGPAAAGQGLSLCPFAAPDVGPLWRVSPAMFAARIFEAISFRYFSYKIPAAGRRAKRAPAHSRSSTVPTETSR